MSQRLLVVIVVLLTTLVVGLALFWQPEIPEPALPKAPPPGEGFTLESARGPVSLKDFGGKLVLLYFGYTYCPDICPTSLASTAEGLNQLKPEELAKVAMLFISVDPERDTPARLQEYAAFFHSAIVGATGSPQQIAEIAGRYGVFYARQKVATAGGGYVVDHTSDTYLVDSSGRLLGKIPHAASPDQVVAEIRKHMNQQ